MSQRVFPDPLLKHCHHLPGFGFVPCVIRNKIIRWARGGHMACRSPWGWQQGLTPSPGCPTKSPRRLGRVLGCPSSCARALLLVCLQPPPSCISCFSSLPGWLCCCIGLNTGPLRPSHACGLEVMLCSPLSQVGCPSSPRGPRTCTGWRRFTGAPATPSPSPSPVTPTMASRTQRSRSPGRPVQQPCREAVMLDTHPFPLAQPISTEQGAL